MSPRTGRKLSENDQRGCLQCFYPEHSCVATSIIGGGAHIHIFMFCTGLWTWIYEYVPPKSPVCYATARASLFVSEIKVRTSIFRYIVRGGTPSFIILVKDTPFQEEFKTKYSVHRWPIIGTISECQEIVLSVLQSCQQKQKVSRPTIVFKLLKLMNTKQCISIF